jgi:hypothetical protein
MSLSLSQNLLLLYYYYYYYYYTTKRRGPILDDLQMKVVEGCIETEGTNKERKDRCAGPGVRFEKF